MDLLKFCRVLADLTAFERVEAHQRLVDHDVAGQDRVAGWLGLHVVVGNLAHWSTFLLSVVPDGLLMHPWSPPGHRHVRSTLEVQHEFCGVRWPRTPRPATGLCAGERRSVSDRLRGPGTTGCSLTARTARKQL